MFRGKFFINSKKISANSFKYSRKYSSGTKNEAIKHYCEGIGYEGCDSHSRTAINRGFGFFAVSKMLLKHRALEAFEIAEELDVEKKYINSIKCGKEKIKIIFVSITLMKKGRNRNLKIKTWGMIQILKSHEPSDDTNSQINIPHLGVP